jgi:hypothetical protein
MQSDLAAERDRYSDKYLYLRQLHGGRRVEVSWAARIHSFVKFSLPSW